MATVRVPFPRRLDIEGALKLTPLLDGLAIADEYEFDFSTFIHAEPFGMLYAAAVVSDFAKQREAKIIGSSFERCGYQSHMGFFQSLGIEHGNKPGEASGGTNYLPITSISVESMKAEAERQGVAVGDIILRHGERMAERLTRTTRGDLFDMLAYSLREIIRNVAEHSSSDAVQFCLQHWPTKNRVHLALLDRGIGVRKSLQDNPHLKINSDIDALKLAIRPGVSGKMYEGVESDVGDRWENSGYGLYLTSRLAASAGNFWIFSGDAALALVGDRSSEYSCPLDGTAIRISLDTRKIGNTRNLVKKFAEDGERYQKLNKERGVNRASPSSRAV